MIFLASIEKFEILNQGKTGLNDVYVLNDPTGGFVVARNDGAGGAADYMNFFGYGYLLLQRGWERSSVHSK